jgi:hypothetical protein
MLVKFAYVFLTATVDSSASGKNLLSSRNNLFREYWREEHDPVVLQKHEKCPRKVSYTTICVYSFLIAVK